MNSIARKSLAGVALVLGLAGAPLAATTGALLSSTAAQASETQQTIDQMRQTLSQYGQFVSNAKYGEVWKPTVTPQGWHPYPACDWVYTKDYGWYFNDKTPWGAIVHHYGRWVHDETDGWLWTPGADFSPGWVVWRTSDQWVGWAPMPPEQDITPASMDRFNDDKLWTFMDARKFGAGCDGVAAPQQTAALYDGTTYVTDMRVVNGVGFFVLPIQGPVVNVNIGVFGPWDVDFVGNWVINWNNIWKVIIDNCGPRQPRDPQRPNLTHSEQPPAPPTVIDRDPPRRGGGGQPPRRTVIRSYDPGPDRVIVDEGPRRPGYQGRPHGGFEFGDRGPRPSRPSAGYRPGRFIDGGFDRGPQFGGYGGRGRGDAPSIGRFRDGGSSFHGMRQSGEGRRGGGFQRFSRD